jgi:hypothetical protein
VADLIEARFPLAVLAALPEADAFVQLNALLALDPQIAEALIGGGLFERLDSLLREGDSGAEAAIAESFALLAGSEIPALAREAVDRFLETGLAWAFGEGLPERRLQAVAFLSQALPELKEKGADFAPIGRLFFSLLDRGDPVITEVALLGLNNFILCFRNADFISSFEFLKMFWEPPLIEDEAVVERFLELLGKLMVLFEGNTFLIECLNWELLAKFSEEEATAFLVDCILHQMTLSESALQCALEHGILDFCRRFFENQGFKTIQISIALLKNVLFVASSDQLCVVLRHEVMGLLFRSLCDCDAPLASAVLVAAERALGDVGSLDDLGQVWEERGILTSLWEMCESEALVEKAERILSRLGFESG